MLVLFVGNNMVVMVIIFDLNLDNELFFSVLVVSSELVGLFIKIFIMVINIFMLVLKYFNCVFVGVILSDFKIWIIMFWLILLMLFVELISLSKLVWILLFSWLLVIGVLEVVVFLGEIFCVNVNCNDEISVIVNILVKFFMSMVIF